MMMPDVLDRLDQGGAEVVCDQFLGSIELFFADSEPGLAQLGAVVSTGEPDESRVAFCANSGQHLLHSILDILQVVLCPLVK